MAKYKAHIDFRGLKEGKLFKAGETLEVTVKRAQEIEENIRKNFPKYEGVEILERVDNKKRD